MQPLEQLMQSSPDLKRAEEMVANYDCLAFGRAPRSMCSSAIRVCCIAMILRIALVSAHVPLIITRRPTSPSSRLLESVA